jgi:hypothetical protein
LTANSRQLCWCSGAAGGKAPGFENAKDFGRRPFFSCVKRQNFDPWDLMRQLAERSLLSRDGEDAGAVADAGFHDSPSDPPAPADHDHRPACQ